MQTTAALTLLATSTHDTKRSEDTRARIVTDENGDDATEPGGDAHHLAVACWAAAIDS